MASHRRFALLNQRLKLSGDKPPFICVVTGSGSSRSSGVLKDKPPFICVVTGRDATWCRSVILGQATIYLRGYWKMNGVRMVDYEGQATIYLRGYWKYAG